MAKSPEFFKDWNVDIKTRKMQRDYLETDIRDLCTNNQTVNKREQFFHQS